MSCGLKPTGHKKFCRYCSGSVNPEHIICTKCGAKIAAGIMEGFTPGATQAAQSVFAKIKNWLVPLIVLGVIVAGLVYVVPAAKSIVGGSSGSPALNQLRSAKSGDWAEYEIAISVPGGGSADRQRFRIEVMSNDGRRVRLQTTVFNAPVFDRGRDVKTDFEIDLSQSEVEIARSMLKSMPADTPMPFEVRDFIDSIKLDIKRDRSTRETLSIAGASFNCIVTPHTIGATIGNITFTARDIKVWHSRTAPVDGMVRAEFRTTVPGPTGRIETLTITIALTSFRKT
jgi:hypothetical protein